MSSQDVITKGIHELLPCKICGGILDREFGSVCTTCLGFEGEVRTYTNPPIILDANDPIPIEVSPGASWHICPDCKKLFEPWRNGRFLVVARCKKCLTSKRVKTVKAVWAKNGGKKPGGRHKEPKHNQVQSEETKAVKYVWSVNPGIMEPANLNTVTLDFTAAPEVLAWLREHHPDIQSYIITWIVSNIPAEVCKNWMLDRLRK
jgi:hypothetical protein